MKRRRCFLLRDSEGGTLLASPKLAGVGEITTREQEGRSEEVSGCVHRLLRLFVFFSPRQDERRDRDRLEVEGRRSGWDVHARVCSECPEAWMVCRSSCRCCCLSALEEVDEVGVALSVWWCQVRGGLRSPSTAKVDSRRWSSAMALSGSLAMLLRAWVLAAWLRKWSSHSRSTLAMSVVT